VQDEGDSHEARLVKQLERSFGIHLREALLPPRPLLGGDGAQVDAGTRYTGLAVASALKTLRVGCTMEGMVGIIICEAKDLTAWLVRRCVSSIPSFCLLPEALCATRPPILATETLSCN
jgi:hypothetical protein